MSESKIEIGGNADDNKIVAGDGNIIGNGNIIINCLTPFDLKRDVYSIEALTNKVRMKSEAFYQIGVPKRVINSLGMEFIYIQSGSFIMGSPKDEPDCYEDETLHKVTLTKDFYIQTGCN